MKRLLSSLIMGTGVLVATGGAWAVPLVIDSMDVTASATATGAGIGTSGPVGLGASSALPGATRNITVDNALDAGTTTAVVNIPPFVGTLNINTGNASDGRGQLHYQFGTTDLTAGIIDPRFRIELLTLNTYLTAALTICSGGPFGTGTCYTDKYDKPAPSDPGYHTVNSQLVNAITGPDEADHFLLSGTGPGTTTNFADRAILTTLDLISLTTCMDPTGTAGAGQGCPGAQYDFDMAGGNGGIGVAAIHPVLMSATDIYLTIGIDTRPAFSQSRENSIDPEIGCLEIVGDGDGPPTTPAPGFPNGRVTVPSACSTPTAIPEPATLSLMGLGLAALGLGAVLKRRGRKV